MPRPSLKKRQDGRYRCKYHGKYFYGLTQQEAYAERDKYIRAEQSGETVEMMTLGEYATQWLPIHKASVIDKTYNDYAKQVNVLIDIVGKKSVSDVTPSDIKSVYNHYIGYSASTIHRAKMLFTAIFDSAIEDRYALHNPCRSDSVKPHKGTSGSHRALTPEEDDIILKVQHRMRPFVLAMRYAGIRKGEAIALNIDKHVDFDTGIIHVVEAIRYDSNQPILAPTKTEAGCRDIPLFEILRHELDMKHGLLVVNSAGQYMSDTAFSRAWSSYVSAVETAMNGISKRWYGRTREQREMKKAGKLPPWKEFTVRPYDLRHSFCTMLRDAGVDMKLAMKWMGHADEKMILQVYDHVTDGRVARAVDDVQDFLRRGQNGGQKKKSSKKR